MKLVHHRYTEGLTIAWQQLNSREIRLLVLYCLRPRLNGILAVAFIKRTERKTNINCHYRNSIENHPLRCSLKTLNRPNRYTIPIEHTCLKL